VDAVERFAATAVAFCEWAAQGIDTGAEAARKGLIAITNLYLAALELAPAWSEELADQPDAERVDDAQWRAVYKGSARLPFDFYADVLDIWEVPPQQLPGIGSLSDDIADIYRDVECGLREYQANRRASAVWEWGSHFRHHWGDHATGAIRVLHAWLAANAFDRLAP